MKYNIYDYFNLLFMNFINNIRRYCSFIGNKINEINYKNLKVGNKKHEIECTIKHRIQNIDKNDVDYSKNFWVMAFSDLKKK